MQIESESRVIHDVPKAHRASSRRLLLIELNEVNLDLVAAYIEDGALSLPGFEALLKRGVITTSCETRYEQLEPWIQWVSAHSGLSYPEHKVFRLGDIVGSDVPQIFEQLEARGLTVGAISPMNTENRLKRPAYFIPDPWTQTPSDPTFWSRRLSAALAQAVNDNATARLTGTTLATLLGAFIRFSSPRNWAQYIKLALGSRGRPWRKALFLDLLLSDIHGRMWRRTRPDFSVIFLNAGAHIQHHYLFNSKVLDQRDLRNPSWYCDPEADPVAEMLKMYDQMLQDALKTEGLDVMVATGLTQVPYDRVKFYYRLKNHAEFLRLVGVDFTEVVTLMTRDFVIHFADEAAANLAAAQLAALRTAGDGAGLFDEIEVRGESLFVALTYPYEISDETCVMLGNQAVPLKEHVAFVAVKNGMHSGKGFVVMPPNSDSAAPAEGAHVKSLHGAVLDFFGEPGLDR